MTYPCPPPDQPGMDIVFGEGFPTPDGRSQLVPASIVPPAEEPDTTGPAEKLILKLETDHGESGRSVGRNGSGIEDTRREALPCLSQLLAHHPA